MSFQLGKFKLELNGHFVSSHNLDLNFLCGKSVPIGESSPQAYLANPASFQQGKSNEPICTFNPDNHFNLSGKSASSLLEFNAFVRQNRLEK